MNPLRSVILLVNIGSPERCTVSSITKYLRTFLMDPYVLQMNFFIRFFLVYFIISFFRAPKTLKKYKQIWTKNGSPFSVFSEGFRAELQNQTNIPVLNGMMYSTPNLIDAIRNIKSEGYDSITLVPLYPQFAESTSLTSINYYLSKVDPSIRQKTKLVPPFFRNPNYIAAVIQNVKLQFPNYNRYKKIIFTYHGLPQSHLKANSCGSSACCASITTANQNCYRAQCYKTSKLLADELLLDESQFTTCFQSRLGRTEWIKPYLEATVKSYVDGGITEILIISPSFTVDGLETLLEIAELEEELRRSGRKVTLDLVKSLNDQKFWVSQFTQILKTKKPLLERPEDNFI